MAEHFVAACERLVRLVFAGVAMTGQNPVVRWCIQAMVSTFLPHYKGKLRIARRVATAGRTRPVVFSVANYYQNDELVRDEILGGQYPLPAHRAGINRIDLRDVGEVVARAMTDPDSPPARTAWSARHRSAAPGPRGSGPTCWAGPCGTPATAWTGRTCWPTGCTARNSPTTGAATDSSPSTACRRRPASSRRPRRCSAAAARLRDVRARHGRTVVRAASVMTCRRRPGARYPRGRVAGAGARSDRGHRRRRRRPRPRRPPPRRGPGDPRGDHGRQVRMETLADLVWRGDPPRRPPPRCRDTSPACAGRSSRGAPGRRRPASSPSATGTGSIWTPTRRASTRTSGGPATWSRPPPRRPPSCWPRRCPRGAAPRSPTCRTSRPSSRRSSASTSCGSWRGRRTPRRCWPPARMPKWCPTCAGSWRSTRCVSAARRCWRPRSTAAGGRRTR